MNLVEEAAIRLLLVRIILCELCEATFIAVESSSGGGVSLIIVQGLERVSGAVEDVPTTTTTTTITTTTPTTRLRPGCPASYSGAGPAAPPGDFLAFCLAPDHQICVWA